MKYLILSLLVLAAGCDTPTRSRFPDANVGQQIADPFVVQPGTVTPVPPTTPTTPATPGFEACTLPRNNSNADLGSVGACKSTLDPSRVRFVTSISSPSSNPICIFPSFRNSAGSTTYIGSPECMATEPNKVYEGGLVKNRPNFTSNPMNAITVMRYALLPDYLKCMDGYDWYFQNVNNGCRNNYQNATCVQNAINHRNQACAFFSQAYPNSYFVISI